VAAANFSTNSAREVIRGDALHTLCCAVWYNIKWLMRAIARLGLRGLLLGLDLLTKLSELERNICKRAGNTG
jgi:hypothetical protein